MRRYIHAQLLPNSISWIFIPKISLQPRGGAGRLNDEERWRTIVHWKVWDSLKSINREYNLNIKTVRNIDKRKKETKGIKDRPHLGKKSKLTVREER